MTNSNRDNRIDDCVAIIASDGNNENLVHERCPLIKMRRIEKAKRIGSEVSFSIDLHVKVLTFCNSRSGGYCVYLS